MRRVGSHVFLSRVLAGMALACAGAASAGEEARCLDDAMLVLDASGSMAGTDLNEQKPQIAKVRDSLAAVLPQVVPQRQLGLMVYGPGQHARCNNIELRLRPAPNSAQAILAEVAGLIPAGQTPLTESVQKAAELLRFRDKQAVVVLLTDGEENCGGDPCRLARQLKAEAAGITIHVIAFKVPGASWLSPGAGSGCMAEETGGLSLTAGNRAELIEALKKTLTCPLFSEVGR